MLATLGATALALFAGKTLWEGNELRPYRDIAGYLTVCGGVTGPHIEDRLYTQAECDEMDAAALERHYLGMRDCVRVELAPGEIVAYTLLAYNIGVGAFCGSTAARRLNAGDRMGACDAILFWNKARVNGRLQVVRGLENRRRWERLRCRAADTVLSRFVVE